MWETVLASRIQSARIWILYKMLPFIVKYRRRVNTQTHMYTHMYANTCTTYKERRVTE